MPRWTGMDKFNSDEHYIYYCGQVSLTRNGLALIVNKRVWNAVLGYSLKNSRLASVHFQGKPFNITVKQVYAPTTNAEEAEVEWFYDDLQAPVSRGQKRSWQKVWSRQRTKKRTQKVERKLLDSSCSTPAHHQRKKLTSPISAMINWGMNLDIRLCETKSSQDSQWGSERAEQVGIRTFILAGR